MRERPFDSLAAKTLQPTTPIALGVAAVAPVRSFTAWRFISPDSVVLLPRFGDVRPDVRFVLKLVQNQFAVVTLVGDHFLDLTSRFCFTKIRLRAVCHDILDFVFEFSARESAPYLKMSPHPAPSWGQRRLGDRAQIIETVHPIWGGLRLEKLQAVGVDSC